MEDLAKFLIKAKKSTYANNNAEEKILKDGSKELIYKENEFEYKDRYFGYNPFIGEEIVWKNGKAIWGMNYYGTVFQKIITSKAVYQFLKEALRKVNPKKPFRGPEIFKKEKFEYKNKTYGNIKKFKGIEMILYKGKRVYESHYHGGIL